MNSFSVNIYYPTMEYLVPFLGFYAMSSIAFTLFIIALHIKIWKSNKNIKLQVMLLAFLNPSGSIGVYLADRLEVYNEWVLWFVFISSPLLTFYAYAWTVS